MIHRSKDNTPEMSSVPACESPEEADAPPSPARPDELISIYGALQIRHMINEGHQRSSASSCRVSCTMDKIERTSYELVYQR